MLTVIVFQKNKKVKGCCRIYLIVYVR